MSAEQKAVLQELLPDCANEFKAYRKTLSYRCQNCSRKESELGEGNKLKACTGCSKIDRKVWYCSRCVTYYFLRDSPCI